MLFGIERWPENAPAFITEDGETWDYGRLRTEALAFKDVLNGRHLVFIICRNAPESVAGYIGIMEQGSVSLLLSEHTAAEQLKILEETYRPSYIYRPAAEGERADYRLGSYGLFATGMKQPEMADDLSLLLSTSGSTGSPKLVRLSRKNLEANAKSIAQYLELNENERPVTSLPMYYTFGLSVINSHLTAGACILMTDKSVVQQAFWDYLSENKGTSISGVPYTYEILKRIHLFDREDIGSITSMIQAGGHLPVELQEEYGKWCRSRGIRFYVMYGQTEATARMSYLPWQDVLRKIGSIGIAIPGGRFSLAGEDGKEIEGTDTVGELIFTGDNVSLGFATCAADLAKPDENKGVLHTGDLAARDEEGYYTIRGRLNRFVKLYGNRVGLDECENILMSMDEDHEYACVGEDDDLVIFTDRPDAEETAQFLASKLNINIRAFRTVKLDEIPKTETGKKDYKALKKRISAPPAPYSLRREEKDKVLTRKLTELSRHHYEKCLMYRNMLNALGTDLDNIEDYRELPFLPTGLFKRLELSSLEEGSEYKVMTSSGTSSQIRSAVVLDGATRTAQQKALAGIGVSFIGEKRLPMLVIDSEETIRNAGKYTARAAGITGFSLFGTRRTFALDSDMALNRSAVDEFLGKYGDQPFLVFGFTYLIWEKLGSESFDMNKAVLIHGGGWKKLESLNISREEFRDRLKKSCGITDIHDYYGMAEQAGSIFMECSEGHFHCSDYSGVVIRRPSDLAECKKGEKGLIQVLSVLPESYPGHSILTEDMGTLAGEDDCPCGRAGAYFDVFGRAPEAEIRGCSDTYEEI